MKSLLMFFGSPEYHATCLSPVLWSIFILAIIYLVMGMLYDARESRNPKRYYRKRYYRTRQGTNRWNHRGSNF